MLRNKIGPLFFSIGYIIYLFSFYIVNASHFQELIPSSSGLFRASYYVFVIFMIFSIIFIQFRFSNLVVSGVFLIIGWLSFKLSNDNVFLIAVLCLVAAQVIDFRKFVRLDICLRTMIFLIVLLSNKFNIITDTVMYRDSGVDRTAFGFLQPNTAGALILSIILEYLILRYSKMKWFDYTFIVLVGFVTFYTTNSRSSVVGIMLSVIITVFTKSKLQKQLKDKIKFLVGNLFFISAIISYLAVRYYKTDNFFWYGIDKLFSGRVHLIQYFVDKYPITFVGQKIQMADGNNLRNTYFLVMDNSYISILLKYGIMSLIFLGAIYYFSTKNIISKFVDIELVIPIIVGCIVGIMETELYVPAYNICLLYMMSYVWRRGKGDIRYDCDY